MLETLLAISAAAWGVLMGLSPVLQIRVMLRRRSSRDVSVGYFGILSVGFLLWIAYGAAAGNVALMVPNTVALLVAMATIVIAVRLRTAGADRRQPVDWPVGGRTSARDTG